LKSTKKLFVIHTSNGREDTKTNQIRYIHFFII